MDKDATTIKEIVERLNSLCKADARYTYWILTRSWPFNPLILNIIQSRSLFCLTRWNRLDIMDILNYLFATDRYQLVLVSFLLDNQHFNRVLLWDKWEMGPMLSIAHLTTGAIRSRRKQLSGLDMDDFQKEKVDDFRLARLISLAFGGRVKKDISAVRRRQAASTKNLLLETSYPKGAVLTEKTSRSS